MYVFLAEHPVRKRLSPMLFRTLFTCLILLTLALPAQISLAPAVALQFGQTHSAGLILN